MDAGVAALLGALIGGAGSLIGTFAAVKHSYNQETRSDERSLRDNKLERLRDAYATVLTAIAELDAVWSLAAYELSDWLVSERRSEVEGDVTHAAKRLGDVIAESRTTVLRSLAILQLESGDDGAPEEVLGAFDTVLRSLSDFDRVLIERNPETIGHEVVKLTGQFGVSQGRLEMAARMHLADLERPL